MKLWSMHKNSMIVQKLQCRNSKINSFYRTLNLQIITYWPVIKPSSEGCGLCMSAKQEGIKHTVATEATYATLLSVSPQRGSPNISFHFISHSVTQQPGLPKQAPKKDVVLKHNLHLLTQSCRRSRVNPRGNRELQWTRCSVFDLTEGLQYC